jgi:hypothetical protein
MCVSQIQDANTRLTAVYTSCYSEQSQLHHSVILAVQTVYTHTATVCNMTAYCSCCCTRLSAHTQTRVLYVDVCTTEQVLVLMILYRVLVMPWRVAFDIPATGAALPWEAFMSLCFAADVVMHFLTGYTEDGSDMPVLQQRCITNANTTISVSSASIGSVQLDSAQQLVPMRALLHDCMIVQLKLVMCLQEVFIEVVVQHRAQCTPTALLERSYLRLKQRACNAV